MVKLIKEKIEASTLVEVLIAMVVIMVAFTIAIGVFSNVLKGGISIKKLQVQAQMEVLVKQVGTEGLDESEILQIDSVSYEMVRMESGIAGMYRLSIRASEQGRLLDSIKVLLNDDRRKEQD
ncbi:type II secretion system protein [Pedobacter sp. GSP4]|uniref:type II secretion system protein n=1 Tax=Pedobacter sp. GSP4 TaxID=3453716 RepID=UPI003EEC31CD